MFEAITNCNVAIEMEMQWNAIEVVTEVQALYFDEKLTSEKGLFGEFMFYLFC